MSRRAHLAVGFTAAMAGIAMWSLNLLAPLLADDFCYAASDLADVWTGAVHEYFNWNGRLVAHLIGPFFTLFPPWVFDFVNTAVFMVLLILAGALALGARWRPRDIGWSGLAAFFLLWFGTPAFGEAFLWQMGSANYLWTTVLVLIFLLPYRLLADDHDVLAERRNLRWIFPALALLAGWTNENTAAAAAVLAVAAVLVHRYRAGTTPSWAVAGLLSQAAGFAAMVMAPGNQVRLASPAFLAWGELSLVSRLIRFVPTLLTAAYSMWLLWILLIGLSIVVWRRRGSDSIQIPLVATSVAFTGASVLSTLLLVASPTAPLRALTGSAVYLSIAVLSAAGATKAVLPRRTGQGAAIIGALALAYSVAGVTADYGDLRAMVEDRNEAVAAALEAGRRDAEVAAITMPRDRHIYWGPITDVTPSESHWANRCVAGYLGLGAIRATNPMDARDLSVLGPPAPVELSPGVILRRVLFSPSHDSLVILLEAADPEALQGSFLDLRLISDQAPWFRRLANTLRLWLRPSTDAAEIEYPDSRATKIAVFSSFSIHSTFLDENNVMDRSDQRVVVVFLETGAAAVESLYVGQRRAHDATMILHRVK